MAPGNSASRRHTQGLAGAPAGCLPTHYRHHTTELESLCKCLDNVMVYDPQSGGTGGLHASPLLVCGPQAHNSSQATAQRRARALPCTGGGLGERPAPPPCCHSDSFTQGVSRSRESAYGQQRSLVPMATEPPSCFQGNQGLSVAVATATPMGSVSHTVLPTQRGSWASRTEEPGAASARTQVPAQPGSQVESLGPKSPCFLLSPVHQPVMSSASSEPGNGDSAEQSQLGLDTVIKVSAVATLQHPPGSGG